MIRNSLPYEIVTVKPLKEIEREPEAKPFAMFLAIPPTNICTGQPLINDAPGEMNITTDGNNVEESATPFVTVPRRFCPPNSTCIWNRESVAAAMNRPVRWHS